MAAQEVGQLTIDGATAKHPPSPPKRLRERQRDLMRHARWHGRITTAEARRFYTQPSDALGRLCGLGLLDRAGRGVYVPRTED